MATQWVRSFNSVSVPHDGQRYFLELLVLPPGRTLTTMHVGVQHIFGYGASGPSGETSVAGMVMMHGLILVPNGDPVPPPLDEPFEPWLLREMAQWEFATAGRDSTDNMQDIAYSRHPTKQLDGQRHNSGTVDQELILSVQMTPNSRYLRVREDMRTMVHVEALQII